MGGRQPETRALVVAGPYGAAVLHDCCTRAGVRNVGGEGVALRCSLGAGRRSGAAGQGGLHLSAFF